MMKTLITLAAGAGFAIALLVSCGDDGVAVDAANPVCDCPAAEPPLAGRIYYVTETNSVPANTRGGTGAVCRAGDQLLGGSCTTADPGARPNIHLDQSGAPELPANPVWICDFMNNENVLVQIKSVAICLDVTP